MSKQLPYRLKNQPQAKVMTQTNSNTIEPFQFVAFFAAFMGIFFFFSKLGHALMGG